MTYRRCLGQESVLEGRGVSVQGVEIRLDDSVETSDGLRRKVVMLAVEVLEGSDDVRSECLNRGENGAALVLSEGVAVVGVGRRLRDEPLQSLCIAVNGLYCIHEQVRS